MKYTHAPWSVVAPSGPMEELMIAEIESDKTYVCAVWGNGEGEVSVANARLIAAAPDMYELLKDFTKLNLSVPSVERELNKRALEILNRINNA